MYLLDLVVPHFFQSLNWFPTCLCVVAVREACGSMCKSLLFFIAHVIYFFVLHQTASIFWALLLLTLASIKHAGSVPGAGFLLQSMNIFRSA